MSAQHLRAFASALVSALAATRRATSMIQKDARLVVKDPERISVLFGGELCAELERLSLQAFALFERCR